MCIRDRDDLTHNPQRPDFIAIVIAKNVTNHVQVSLRLDFLSHHNPLFITIREIPASLRPPGRTRRNPRPIAWKETVKFVCIRLDRRLCVNAHVTETIDKVRGVQPKWFSFLSCRSRLPLRTKVTVYLLFLRSVPVSYTHLDVYKRQVKNNEPTNRRQ